MAGLRHNRLGAGQARRSDGRSTGYALTSANDFAGRDPKNWKLQGSNDGQGWTDLDTRTNEVFPQRFQTRQFSFTNTTAYQYYRLDISANSGEPIIQLAELFLIGPDAARRRKPTCSRRRSASPTGSTRPTTACR